ncbi:MAG: sigma-70 family RNA polymerase sigma factor, partial [Chloroflexota bacterium]|nr:sigma-70 family RNA polymerase sigma factor [Chloroflexota bacterium]
LLNAAAGDIAAFARIVAEHHDHMARVCFVICGDQDMAQDAVQAAWPIAWRKLSSLREPDRLRPWLITIAANEARQALRRQRRRGVVEIDVADVGGRQHDPSLLAARIDLVAALRRLSAEDRSILALRHISGFDATEIGRAMGMSASGVRSRLARAAARLRSELDDD